MHHDSYLMLQLVETNSNLFHLKCLYSMLVRMVVQSKKRLWRYNENIQVIGQDLWPWTLRHTMLVMAQCTSDSNKKFDPIQRMATLSMCPSASRRPTSPDQCSASRNIASDVKFFIKTCEWIAAKDVVKFALLKSKSSMTVKCTT